MHAKLFRGINYVHVPVNGSNAVGCLEYFRDFMHVFPVLKLK